MKKNNKTININKSQQDQRFKDIMNDLKATTRLVALKDIPIELLAIDESYQTPERTNRGNAITKLAKNWDENKLEPIAVVPHVDECKFYVVNGYGRWQASQMQTPNYEYLYATVLLGATNMNVDERRRFESELFAYQDREVSTLKPIQIHGALMNLGNEAVIILEELRKKYKFSYLNEKGNRAGGVLGSYSETLNIAKVKGKDCLEYIFGVCQKSAFHKKSNGYASYVVRTLKDAWSAYPEDREDTKKYLSEYLRGIDPAMLKATAIVKYPMLESRMACSLLIEDLIVENLSLQHSRTIQKGKVVKVAFS